MSLIATDSCLPEELEDFGDGTSIIVGSFTGCRTVP